MERSIEHRFCCWSFVIRSKKWKSKKSHRAHGHPRNPKVNPSIYFPSWWISEYPLQKVCCYRRSFATVVYLSVPCERAATVWRSQSQMEVWIQLGIEWVKLVNEIWFQFGTGALPIEDIMLACPCSYLVTSKRESKTSPEKTDSKISNCGNFTKNRNMLFFCGLPGYYFFCRVLQKTELRFSSCFKWTRMWAKGRSSHSFILIISFLN